MSNTMSDTTFVAVAFGSLASSAEYKANSRRAKGLPGNLPVLSATVDLPELEVLKRTNGRGNAPSCFGFGHIQMQTISGDPAPIMTIRFQLGGVQVYWLADMSDGDVWRAIDAWRKRKQVPLSIGHSTEMVFTILDYAVERMVLDKFRGEIRPEATPDFPEIAATLASSGIIEAQATTDIPGVELELVVVNVLVSPRLSEFVSGKLMRDKPVIASSASFSVH